MAGASRGIGRATADAFLARGWRVVAGMRDPADGTNAPGLHVARLDVTDPASVRDGVAAAHEVAGGSLGCVVYNAGWALFGAVEDVDLGLARHAFETNLFGAVAVMQAVLPPMRRAGSGVVVGVSTLSGRIPSRSSGCTPRRSWRSRRSSRRWRWSSGPPACGRC